MSWSVRRASAVVATVALLGVLASLQMSAAQQVRQLRKRPFPGGPPGTPPVPPKTASGDPTDLGGITVMADESEQALLAGKIRAAQHEISVENWPEAIRIIQEDLLERPEDALVPVTRRLDGKTVKVISSIRREANRLVGNLPPKGMEVYRLTYEPRAAEALKVAKEADDPRMLAEIMSRYLYTEAGAEATDLLATRLLDRGQYSAAALCFERLFHRMGPEKLSVATLFRSALAFQRTNDKGNLAKAWKIIDRKTNDIKLGDKKLTTTELKEWVASRKSSGSGSTRHDWTQVGGDATRSAQGVGGTAFLNPRWKFETWKQSAAKTWIDKAIVQITSRKAPLLHGFAPLAATLNREDGKIPLMIYRDFWGIHARPLRDVGEDQKKDDFVKAGEVYWESPSAWSLDRMLSEPKHLVAITGWLNQYVDPGRLRPEALFENSVVGSLSTDNVRVYAIDDFQVPPYEHQQFNQFRGGMPTPGVPAGPLQDAMYHNKLQAYDLDSGKLVWEVGAREDDKAKDSLHDCFFLGPPLPLGGKLYVLADKNQELRLLCLDPTDGRLVARPQRLADAREKIQVDNTRRFHASHLAYGEGILVCPTNTGGLLGVDLLTNSLVWAYGYREKGFAATGTPQIDPRFGRPPPPGFQFGPDGRPVPVASSSAWKTTPPVIAQGKVVFTAPDASSVHCINLRDGSRLWKHPRQEGDVYLAGVFAGKVVLVGKQYARGLSLVDGSEVWRVETGMPSGIGIASKDVYYLPLAAAVKTHEPEICLIDVKEGRVLAHTRSRKKEVPGNLLFFEGDVLSQSLTQVADYPQLEVELKQIDGLLAKQPNDPEGRARRGDLRLDKGDLKGAIEDLRVALAGTEKTKLTGDLEANARTKLYESLTEYFQADFDSAEKYLKEYEAMCSVAPANDTPAARSKAQAEEKRRKGSFYGLVGRGREKQALRPDIDTTVAQKRLIQAFEAYMNFGALGQADQELMGVVGDPGVKVSPAVWSEGRIATMVASAGAARRLPLEKMIRERYDSVKKTGKVEALRGFVNTFGTISTVGREARMELAERLIDSADKNNLVDAERHLSLLRLQTEDRQMAGRAVEALARLMTRQGLMDDATHYYRVLGRDFADVVIKDGKTGLDYFNHLATDKRLLLFLGGANSLPDVKLTYENVREDRSTYPYSGTLYRLEQEGEKLPYFKQYLLAMQTNYNQFWVYDREKMDDATYQTKGEWSKNLTSTHLQMLLQQRGGFPGQPPAQPRLTFKNLGHLVILPLGHMVFAIDPVNQKVLWEKNLAGSSGPTTYTSHTIDPRDGSIQVTYSDGWTQRLGQTGPVSPSAVCLQTSDALVAVDPVSGQVLWTRSDIPKNCHLYHDAQHVFVVEVGGDGTAGTSRVFRLHDGVDVRAKDFSTAYQKRVRMLGNTILYSDAETGRAGTLHLYDVLAGQDRWKKDFPAGSIVLQPESDGFGGIVEPDGKVTIVDLKKAAVVYTTTLKRAEDLATAKVHAMRLLHDRHAFYILCDAPPDTKVQAGSMMSNLMPNTGLRAVPVNGRIYSLNRHKANADQYDWFNEAPNQMLVLDEFAELPMVMLTSRYGKWMIPGQQIQNVIAIRSYDKQTGKMIYDREDTSQSYQQFHSLIVNARLGKVELRSYNLRLVYNLFARADGGKAKEGGATPGGGSMPSFPPPLPRGGLRKLGAAPGFRPQFAQPQIFTK